jgi:hypothetical protein
MKHERKERLPKYEEKEKEAECTEDNQNCAKEA